MTKITSASRHCANAPFVSPKRPEHFFFLKYSSRQQTVSKLYSRCTQQRLCVVMCGAIHFCLILTIFGIRKIILAGKTFFCKISLFFFSSVLELLRVDRQTDGQTDIPQSVLRQVHSLFQSDFFTHSDLVFSLSITSILSFPYGHPVADYVFFLVFSSLLSFPLSFLH